MKQKLTVQELIVRIADKSGATKKMTTELLRILPEVVEDGLARDGEVRINGLGTFKLKWVKERFARNMKTGERVEVPAHSKVVFYPERGLKDSVNKDYRFLTYQVIEEEKAGGDKSSVISHQSSVVSHQSTVESPQPPVEEEKKMEPVEKEPSFEATPVPPVVPETPEAEDEPAAPVRRKTIYWIIPLIFVILALLVVVFYMKNCQDGVIFPPQKQQSQEQVLQPSEPVAAPADTMNIDTIAETLPAEQETVEPPKEQKPAPPVKSTGFPEQSFVTRGEHLFQVAREKYGNPFLWALIYKENIGKIADPQYIAPGTALVIPALEGTPLNLSRSDSAGVSDGYKLLFEYYTSKGDERAKDFRYAMKAYSPK